MIILYRGSGSGECQIEDHGGVNPIQWRSTRRNACDLLSGRGFDEAARTLETVPFEVRSGTNSFGDDFYVLYVELSVPEYLDWELKATSEDFRHQFSQIASTIRKLGLFVRFVVAELRKDESPIRSHLQSWR